MKSPFVVLVLITILLMTGCVSQVPQGTSPGPGQQFPVSVDPLTSGKPLPMDRHVFITAKNTTFETWIDSFETGEIQENGNQELTIYVAAKNTGSDPIRMTWFFKLTDPNGKTYGGIGISHGGNGARSNWIQFNHTEMARDYVIINSDRDLQALSKGATLDVYYMEKPLDDVPIPDVPDYHTTWTINPGVIH